MKYDLLNIVEYQEEGIGEGTGEMIEEKDWSVLILNYFPGLAADKIADMQKHLKTKECFILLEGKAVLIVADGEESPDNLQAYEMEKGKIYMVPQGIWHKPMMKENAKILLIENSGTVAENSPRCSLNENQMQQIENWQSFFDK